MDLNGAGTIVAGGASGLGAATARELAARGARVAIADLNEENANAVAEEVGGVAFKTDVTSEDEVRAAVEGAVEARGAGRGRGRGRGVGWDPFRGVVRGDRLGRARGGQERAGEPAAVRDRDP